MAVESFTEKMLRARREKGGPGWTLDDERRWLEANPDDSPLDGYEHALLPTPDEVSHDEDVIPDIDAYEQSEEDQQVDAIIDRIGIVEAYNKWAGKGTVDPRGRTESIKVRCPNPSHPDHDPSAWLNTDKEVWVCAGCGFEGGDKFDIAAWSLGFPVPGYKDGKKFPELRRQMAASMGYTVRRDRASGKDYAEKSDPEPEPDAPSPVYAEPQPEAEREHSASVTAIHTAAPQPDSIENTTLRLDWRSVVDEGTFLDAWMKATTQDDLPEEYHFWTGMMALGMAIGNDVVLNDYKPVYGNLFCVIIGETGSGKSRSVGHLTSILRTVLPYDDDDPTNTGVNILKGIGSGETLIDNFRKVHDDGSGIIDNIPVRGLMEFDELASLVGKSSYTGSILKPVLMEFYDKADIIAAKSRTFGSVEAHGAFGSCITTTQPSSIRELVNKKDADSGFLNRWVFVWGERKKLAAYGGFYIDLEEPAKKLRSVRSWAATHRTIQMELEGEALEAWVKFFDDNIDPLTSRKVPGDSNDGQEPLLARVALTFKKFIVLFAANNKELSPSKKSVEQAIALWPYIKQSYKMVGARISSSRATDVEDRILEYCQSKKDGVKRKDVVNALKYSFERDEIRRGMNLLEELGILEEVTLPRKKGARGPAPIVMKVSGA